MQTISINKKLDYSAPILFIPLSAQVQKDKPTGTPITVKSRAQKPIAPKVVPKKTTPTKTNEKKTTTIATPAKAVATKAEIKTIPIVEKKKDTSSFAKASSSAKATADKSADTPVLKAEVKKEEPKTIQAIESSFAKATADTQKPVEPAPSLAKALNIEAAIIPVQQEAIQTDAHAQPETPQAEVPGNAIVSNNYREVEALRRGAQLQKELVHKWHPPIGVSPDCTCEISFFVNNKGIIENLKMVKSSGVMMFDISARQALFAMKMPQWTYGNPLTISFKQ